MQTNYGGMSSGVSDTFAPLAPMQIGADPRISGAQFQRGLAQQKELALAPLDWAKQRFNTILPMLQGAIGGMGGAPGANVPVPQITAGPVFSDQQIQQQVNQARGATDAGTATQQRNVAQNLAGRGFGSNSPLQQALQTNLGAMGRQTGAEQETNIRLGAAQQNAQQKLASQQAAAQAQLGAAQIGVEAQRPWWQYRTSLLGALAGLA